MSELHKFLFDGLPVRGALVRLTDAWREVLQRRASNPHTGAYPEPVAQLLGEMTAAAVLMQSSIKFDGALVLQVMGDGPVPLAAVEVQHDLALRSTATVQGEIPAQADLGALLDPQGGARCAITLDPRNRFPGQQPYQGIVSLRDDQGRSLSGFAPVLEQYMLRSEQLQTTLVLAANDQIAAGLLIQRLPVQGSANLEGSQGAQQSEQDAHYEHIAVLARSLQAQELLTLDADTILRRLFWEEKLRRFEPQTGVHGPRFACSCSREKVARMILGLGQQEATDLVHERGQIEVGCEYCGQQYHFDAIDAQQVFTEAANQAPGSEQRH